jgi:hypothetical protein
MSEGDVRDQILDEEHLRLLSIGYWVSAGSTAFFSLFGLMHMGMGVFFTFVPSTHGKDDLPSGVGWMFAAFGFVGFTIMIGLAILKVRVAQCLKRRRSRTFCLVMAGLCCLGLPYGTVLGVFTFLVMARPSVKRLFESG